MKLNMATGESCRRIPTAKFIAANNRFRKTRFRITPPG
jgi:hypothetical protein